MQGEKERREGERASGKKRGGSMCTCLKEQDHIFTVSKKPHINTVSGRRGRNKPNYPADFSFSF